MQQPSESKFETRHISEEITPCPKSEKSFLTERHQCRCRQRHSSRVTLEPLERGFGYTLGNALAVFFCPLCPGAAVTEVRIEGISHEYSAVPGAQEDVIAILLNLKNLAVRMHNREEAVLRVTKKAQAR